MKKLSSYLSAGIAATASLQSTDAATIVTLYGPGAQNPTTTPATPTGISIGLKYSGAYVDTLGSKSSFFSSTKSGTFSSGNDLNALAGFTTSGNYFYNTTFLDGAQLGSVNYANISFNGADSVYEAVGQFYFDGAGGGYLVALAINNDASALSISQGKAAIDAVPEPSAIALLSLGAGGLMLRRRRKVA